MDYEEINIVFATSASSIIHFALPKILHEHCFQFHLGHTVVPREFEKKLLCKTFGGKQSVLWEM